MAQVKLLKEHITIAMFISWLCFCLPQGRMISLGNPLICIFFLENPVPMSELWPTVICTKYAVRICSRCHIICFLILGFTMMVYFLVTYVAHLTYCTPELLTDLLCWFSCICVCRFWICILNFVIISGPIWRLPSISEMYATFVTALLFIKTR